jgi:ATP-dependent DNA ligase
MSNVLDVIPQLCSAAGLKPLRAAVAEPTRYAIEPKVDGVRGLIVYEPSGVLTARNRQGQQRQWLHDQPLARELRRLGRRLPILHDGTVLEGELVAERFAGTMAALHGSKRHGDALRFVVFDVPYLAGVDLRGWTWTERRERLELLASRSTWSTDGWRASSSRTATRPTATALGQDGGRSRTRRGGNARRGGSTGDEPEPFLFPMRC